MPYKALACYWAKVALGDTLEIRDGELCGNVSVACPEIGERTVINRIRQLWTEESGQDVAEYAVMLAVILVIVIGTVRLIGSNANTVFSQVGSQLGQ